MLYLIPNTKKDKKQGDEKMYAIIFRTLEEAQKVHDYLHFQLKVNPVIINTLELSEDTNSGIPGFPVEEDE